MPIRVDAAVVFHGAAKGWRLCEQLCFQAGFSAQKVIDTRKYSLSIV